MTEPRVSHVSATRIQRKQTLVANVIRACTNCGAPGHWHAVPGVNPGCYDPVKTAEAAARGEVAPVGLICPNCGAKRPGVEARGVIWTKIWSVGLGTVLKDTIIGFWKGKK